MPTRTYRFALTVTVADGHEGYDDPEWVADAAWGALTSGYGITCTYGQIELLGDDSDDLAVVPPRYPPTA